MSGERILEVNREMCVCFIDWREAFDKVDWNIIIKILKDTVTDWEDRSLIKELRTK